MAVMLDMLNEIAFIANIACAYRDFFCFFSLMFLLVIFVKYRIYKLST